MRPQIYREMKVLESDDLLTRSIIPTKRMPILNNTVFYYGAFQQLCGMVRKC